MTYDYVANFDGGCWKNPGGRATWGYIVKNPAGQIVAKDGGIVGEGPDMSNNVAEFYALEQLLRFINNLPSTAARFLVRGDSQVVINSIRRGKISKGLCQHYSYSAHLVASNLKFQGRVVDYQWVRREHNDEADSLTVSHSSDSVKKSKAKRPTSLKVRVSELESRVAKLEELVVQCTNKEKEHSHENPDRDGYSLSGGGFDGGIRYRH